MFVLVHGARPGRVHDGWDSRQGQVTQTFLLRAQVQAQDYLRSAVSRLLTRPCPWWSVMSPGLTPLSRVGFYLPADFSSSFNHMLFCCHICILLTFEPPGSQYLSMVECYVTRPYTSISCWVLFTRWILVSYLITCSSAVTNVISPSKLPGTYRKNINVLVIAVFPPGVTCPGGGWQGTDAMELWGS